MTTEGGTHTLARPDCPRDETGVPESRVDSDYPTTRPPDHLLLREDTPTGVDVGTYVGSVREGLRSPLDRGRRCLRVSVRVGAGTGPKLTRRIRR